MLDTIRSAVRLDDRPTVYRYRCTDCEMEFLSGKAPDRARCEECLEPDVEIIDRRRFHL